MESGLVVGASEGRGKYERQKREGKYDKVHLEIIFLKYLSYLWVFRKHVIEFVAVIKIIEMIF